MFQQCVEALFMVKDQHPQAVKEATTSILPVWLEAFRVLLNIDPRQDLNKSEWDGLLIRIQIYKVRCRFLSPCSLALIREDPRHHPHLIPTRYDHLPSRHTERFTQPSSNDLPGIPAVLPLCDRLTASVL